MKKRFDYVEHALPEMKTREFQALVHMIAVRAKCEHCGKYVKSATLFTKDRKATVKISRMHEPSMAHSTVVISFGEPCYADDQKRGLKDLSPSGIKIVYEAPKKKKK